MPNHLTSLLSKPIQRLPFVLKIYFPYIAFKVQYELPPVSPQPPASPPAAHLLAHSFPSVSQTHQILPSLCDCLRTSAWNSHSTTTGEAGTSSSSQFVTSSVSSSPVDPRRSLTLAFLCPCAMSVDCVILHGLLTSACLISRQDSKFHEGQGHVCVARH